MKYVHSRNETLQALRFAQENKRYELFKRALDLMLYAHLEYSYLKREVYVKWKSK